MGFEAYTHDDRGAEVIPGDRADWQDWVSASKTRNWCNHDPLLDWLDLYGKHKGFVPDAKPDLRIDFQEFVFAQGNRFEAAVVAHLTSKVEVCSFAGGMDWSMSMDACRQTFDAMTRGVPIIHQGVVRNAKTRTYGATDLLVRSDVLFRLFPDALTEAESSIGASGIGATSWHYRVVDIKFTTLELDRAWHAANSHLAYMVQTAVYNNALGRIQGYLAPSAYLLGRGWKKGTRDAGSTSCMDRLAPVRNAHVVRGEALETIVDQAVEWIRRLRREGHGWDPRVQPIMPELRPNPGNGQDQPWHGAVAQLAEELEDVTLAWQVGLPGRKRALAQGIERWTDPRFTAEVAGVNGAYRPALDMMLDLNRSPGGPGAVKVLPRRVEAGRSEWGVPAGVEFFVDFETVSNLDDDFKRIPEQNGQPLIFMIGCGHVEDAQWQFSCFIAKDLTAGSEAGMVDDWLAHMETVRRRIAPSVARPLVFHWSPAETSTLSGLESARERSPERAKAWEGEQEPNWYDFLNRVIKKGPVVVRGPMGFGLKTVGKSLKRHGLIETEWPGGILDGLGAMVAAWSCYAESARTGRPVAELELMDEPDPGAATRGIKQYNEIDSKVMMEVIAYLRARH